MDSGMLVWKTPGHEYVAKVEKQVGKGKRKRTVVVEVPRKVGPQLFSRSAEAYEHARKHSIPLRLVKMYRQD